LGEYGVWQVFSDAYTWGRLQIDSLVTGWGMTGVAVLLGLAVIWKLFLRVR
jgi:hypothetical protein